MSTSKFLDSVSTTHAVDNDASKSWHSLPFCPSGVMTDTLGIY